MANRTVSPRPKLRPGSSRATSPRPKLRPADMGAGPSGPSKRGKSIGGMKGGSTRGVDPVDNYSAEDLMKLLGSAAMGGGMAGVGSAAGRAAKKVLGKKNGGKVRGYEGGGKVCRGNGRAYQGKPKKVQVR